MYLLFKFLSLTFYHNNHYQVITLTIIFIFQIFYKNEPLFSSFLTSFQKYLALFFLSNFHYIHTLLLMRTLSFSLLFKYIVSMCACIILNILLLLTKRPIIHSYIFNFLLWDIGSWNIGRIV